MPPTINPVARGMRIAMNARWRCRSRSMMLDGGGFARFSGTRLPSGVHTSFCGRQADLLEDGAVNHTGGLFFLIMRIFSMNNYRDL